MSQKLTVTSATNYDKKKDGTPMLDNKGRQKYRSVIKTVERGEEMMSGFVFKPIQAGEVIEAELKPETYNGVTRMSFSIVTPASEVARAAGNDSAVISELKNHTVLLKNIHNTLEDIRIAFSTHSTIEAMRKGEPQVIVTTFDEQNIGEFPTEAMPVLDEEDFGNPFE